MIDLILAILCAFRLTQLLVWDDILSPVTCWLANKHRLLDELFGCAHCLGFWCALVTVVAVAFQDQYLVVRIGAWAFAVSGAVSLIQHATGWLDTEIPELPKASPDRDAILASARATFYASIERYQQDAALGLFDEPKGEGDVDTWLANLAKAGIWLSARAEPKGEAPLSITENYDETLDIIKQANATLERLEEDVFAAEALGYDVTAAKKLMGYAARHVPKGEGE